MSRLRELTKITGAFLKLGLISFGGPVAHLGYLREEFVTRRRWLSDDAYGDLVALCQFLPGPASSQAVFALGMQRAGWLGGLVASLSFTLPSAVLMILFGYGVVVMEGLQAAGWVHGLKLAAVAVVAQAVWGMGISLCPDRARVSIGLGAAVALLVFPGARTQIGVIALGAATGWWLYRGALTTDSMKKRADGKRHLTAVAALIVFLLLLLGLPWLASATGHEALQVFDTFYRAGSLVFGGGHVVLPLLQAEVVTAGWVSGDAFLAGYGAVQAVPGPLFTFAAYLGTVMVPGPRGWLGGLWCLLAIFLPAWLLIGGTLPFWHQLRTQGWVQAALRGANAAVVGVLLAAFYQPVWTDGVQTASDAATVVVAFGLLRWWKVPPWAVVVLAAATGQWLLG